MRRERRCFRFNFSNGGSGNVFRTKKTKRLTERLLALGDDDLGALLGAEAGDARARGQARAQGAERVCAAVARGRPAAVGRRRRRRRSGRRVGGGGGARRGAATSQAPPSAAAGAAAPLPLPRQRARPWALDHIGRCCSRKRDWTQKRDKRLRGRESGRGEAMRDLRDARARCVQCCVDCRKGIRRFSACETIARANA